VGSKRDAPDAEGGDGDAAADAQEAKTEEDADGGDAKRSRVE
jgi:hypothetical protein